MKSKKVIIVDGGFDSLYKNYIEKFVIQSEYNDINFVTESDFRKEYGERRTPDLILFTGGTDLNPSYYGQKQGEYTDKPNKTRDNIETETYNRYSYKDVPKLGICRGAQLLCVMNGGKLIQHVEGHNSGSHPMSYNSNLGNPLSKTKVLNVPSDHHQMMYPYSCYDDSYNIIGWSTNYRSDTYLNGSNEEVKIPKKFLEPEIVYFKTSNSLAIQFHPEYNSFNSSGKILIANTINRLLFKKY